MSSSEYSSQSNKCWAECVYAGLGNRSEERASPEQLDTVKESAAAIAVSLHSHCVNLLLTMLQSQDAIMQRLASIEDTLQNFAAKLERLV